MANTEFHESINALESQQSGFGSLSDYAMVRNSTQALLSDQKSNDNLVGNGTLPSFEIKDGASQQTLLKAPRPLAGADITTKEMKESGVSAAQEKDGDTKTTNARYPGGVEVSVSNGKTLTSPEGHEIKVSNVTLVQVKPPLHESKPLSGVWVDEKGRAMVKVNDDGTVTVDTGKGFYTQGPDGVKRVSALRSRDSKDFEVIDTDSPLGNLRPSNQTQQRRK